MSNLLPARVVDMLALLRTKSAEDLGTRLLKRAPTLRRLRTRQDSSPETLDAIWAQLEAAGVDPAVRGGIGDAASRAEAAIYGRNIENFIGTAKLPMGVIGPLRINGINANGEFFVPMATSEAALVASYGRGADVATMAGGITAGLLGEGVLRTPAFVFDDMLQCGLFIDWIARNAETLKTIAESTTRHGRLQTIEPFMDSDTVFLICRYTTGDAAGQNMVTVATEAICVHIAAEAPIKPRHMFVEGNFSGFSL